MGILNAGDGTLDRIIRQNRVVLVDFWAPWCMPCRMQSPILDRLAEEEGDGVVIAKVNVDENPLLAARHRIRGIPTLKLFVGGLETASMTGVQSLGRLKELVSRYAS